MSRFEIKFSVDEDNLFTEILNICDSRWATGEESIQELQSFIATALEAEDPATALQHLHNLRAILFDLDALCEDVAGILTGYVEHKENRGVPDGEG